MINIGMHLLYSAYISLSLLFSLSTYLKFPFLYYITNYELNVQIYIIQELNVPEQDVEQLLVSLILDNRIHGHIDQVNRLLECWDRSKGTKKYAAVEKWNTQLKSLYQTINNRVC